MAGCGYGALQMWPLWRLLHPGCCSSCLLCLHTRSASSLAFLLKRCVVPSGCASCCATTRLLYKAVWQQMWTLPVMRAAARRSACVAGFGWICSVGASHAGLVLNIHVVTLMNASAGLGVAEHDRVSCCKQQAAAAPFVSSACSKQGIARLLLVVRQVLLSLPNCTFASSVAPCLQLQHAARKVCLSILKTMRRGSLLPT